MDSPFLTTLLAMFAVVAAAVGAAWTWRRGRPSPINKTTGEATLRALRAAVSLRVPRARVRVVRVRRGGESALDEVLPPSAQVRVVAGARLGVRLSAQHRRLVVPMHARGELLGVVAVDPPVDAPFSESELAGIDAEVAAGAARLSALRDAPPELLAHDAVEELRDAHRLVEDIIARVHDGASLPPGSLEAVRDALASLPEQLSPMLPVERTGRRTAISLAAATRTAAGRLHGERERVVRVEVPEGLQVPGDDEVVTAMLHSILRDVSHDTPVGVEVRVRVVGGRGEGVRLEVTRPSAGHDAEPSATGFAHAYCSRVATLRGWWLRRVAREHRVGVELIFPASVRYTHLLAA
jgi:hypothetical protein